MGEKAQSNKVHTQKQKKETLQAPVWFFIGLPHLNFNVYFLERKIWQEESLWYTLTDPYLCLLTIPFTLCPEWDNIKNCITLADMQGLEVNKTINVMQQTPWWRNILQKENRGTRKNGTKKIKILKRVRQTNKTKKKKKKVWSVKQRWRLMKVQGFVGKELSGRLGIY